MYKPKTIYHSFGNRLGVLRRALASDIPDKYLRNHYKNIPISDGDEIYNEDMSLISFYFRECRIDSGRSFDSDKFYKEAERRIKGIEKESEVIVPLEQVQPVDDIDIGAGLKVISEPEIMAEHKNSIFSSEQELEFLKLLAKLFLKVSSPRFIDKGNFSIELFAMIRELPGRNQENKMKPEEMVMFVDWFKKNFYDFLEEEDDIPF